MYFVCLFYFYTPSYLIAELNWFLMSRICREMGAQFCEVDTVTVYTGMNMVEVGDGINRLALCVSTLHTQRWTDNRNRFGSGFSLIWDQFHLPPLEHLLGEEGDDRCKQLS